MDEVIECLDRLTQRAGSLIGAERVVVARLLGDSGRELIACSCLVRQLGLFRLVKLDIGVSHRQARRLGNRVFLLFELLEVLHRRLIVAHLISCRTEHVHILADRLCFLLRYRRLVLLQVLRCLRIVRLQVVHLAQNTMEFAVVRPFRVSVQQLLGTLLRFLVMA